MPGQTRPGRAAAILVQSSSGRPHCQVLQTFPLIDCCFLRASSRSPCLRGKGPPRAQDPPTGANILTEVPERLQKHSKSRPGALQEATKTHREEPKQPCQPNQFNKSASQQVKLQAVGRPSSCKSRVTGSWLAGPHLSLPESRQPEFGSNQAPTCRGEDTCCPSPPESNPPARGQLLGGGQILSPPLPESQPAGVCGQSAPAGVCCTHAQGRTSIGSRLSVATLDNMRPIVHLVLVAVVL